MDNPVGYLIGGIVALGAAVMAASAFASSSSLPEGVTNVMSKKYKFHQKLGRGAFGTVYLVERIGNGKLYALKTIVNTSAMSREPRVMKSLRHANVTQLYDLSIDSANINMVMDYMQGGSLQHRLFKKKRLSLSTTRLYFLQLCEAIDYLHNMNITHRDLKPDNILLASNDENTLIKVSDFGLSKNHVEYYLTSGCGTKLFMAPEYWGTKAPYSNKVDVWSLGVILYYCISGELPFLSKEDICNAECTFNQPVWQSYESSAPIEIIKKLLTKNSTYRPEISDILELLWLLDENLIRTYAALREKFSV